MTDRIEPQDLGDKLSKLLSQHRSSARIEKIRSIIDQCPLKYKLLYARTLLGLVSPRQAIKMKCVECVGFEDVQERVKNCNSYRCALLEYRKKEQMT